MAATAATAKPPGQSSSVALTSNIMTKLKPAKIIKGAVDPPSVTPAAQNPRASPAPPRQITGIDFDDRGDTVITAAEDETFRLYNCKTGKHAKTLFSKKYGVDLPRFTHKNSCILHASTKEDDTLRYHSLHDNKYLQYFKGHTGRVTSLEVSPVDDGFISAAQDQTVRLWDLRTPTCRGLLSLPSPPVVAYDSTGVVFAVAVNVYSRVIMYDQANYDKAPFLVITLHDPTLSRISHPPRPIYMTSLSFSSNGKYLLVGCSGDAHYILDAFEGHLLAKLEGHIGLERGRPGGKLSIEPVRGASGDEVKWTGDSKYVIGGSLEGKVHVWNVQNLQAKSGPIDLMANPPVIKPMVSLDGHPGSSRCVKFNPRYAMLCTAGTELAFWLPDQSTDDSEIVKELLGGNSRKRPMSSS